MAKVILYTRVTAGARSHLFCLLPPLKAPEAPFFGVGGACSLVMIQGSFSGLLLEQDRMAGHQDLFPLEVEAEPRVPGEMLPKPQPHGRGGGATAPAMGRGQAARPGGHPVGGLLTPAWPASRQWPL